VCLQIYLSSLIRSSSSSNSKPSSSFIIESFFFNLLDTDGDGFGVVPLHTSIVDFEISLQIGFRSKLSLIVSN
jgi:hypothetical protein